MTPLDRITEAARQFDRKGATVAADEFAAMVIAAAVFETGERDPELRVLYAQ